MGFCGERQGRVRYFGTKSTKSHRKLIKLCTFLIFSTTWLYQAGPCFSKERRNESIPPSKDHFLFEDLRVAFGWGGFHKAQYCPPPSLPSEAEGTTMSASQCTEQWKISPELNGVYRELFRRCCCWEFHLGVLGREALERSRTNLRNCKFYKAIEILW